MSLRRRVEQLEYRAGNHETEIFPGAVLVVGDPQNLDEQEQALLDQVTARLGPGGAVVLLPDNGRGDR